TPAKGAEPKTSKPAEPAPVVVVTPPAKPESRPSVPSRSAPTFAKDVQQIVTAKCINCHGNNNKKKGGLDLRTLHALHKGGASGQAVVGGHMEMSLLWESVDNGTMPPGKPKLTSAEKDTLRRWIEGGAKWQYIEPEARAREGCHVMTPFSRSRFGVVFVVAC